MITFQVELATGTFPYETWVNPIDQLQQLIHGDPPRLPQEQFSKDFQDFVAKMYVNIVLILCLKKTQENFRQHC